MHRIAGFAGYKLKKNAELHSAHQKDVCNPVAMRGNPPIAISLFTKWRTLNGGSLFKMIIGRITFFPSAMACEPFDSNYDRRSRK